MTAQVVGHVDRWVCCTPEGVLHILARVDVAIIASACEVLGEDEAGQHWRNVLAEIDALGGAA